MKIQKSFKGEEKSGKLYLVPTPIGNLQDISLRALEVLKAVDVICAEDTRNTGQLLKHFSIPGRQVSFHEHNAREKIPGLLALLEAGQSIAQVSDAGMPSISDPGHDLVLAAIEKDIPVIALPGPSAGLTGLIASGLLPQPHVFYGFLPRKKGQQRAFFESKKDYPETQIYYESPYRLVDTLTNIKEVYGNRQVVLVRELTKLYEEYQRGYCEEIIAHLESNPVKGECLLLVAGAQSSRPSTEVIDPLELVEELIAQGEKTNHAIKKIAKTYGLNRQELYHSYHGLDSEVD
ncbi:16S rRNA (cytidine(1402)-2'-O)-methyltransferase [Streptococcus cuniculipharyngis]|uniref:Ribosomal RNA small subunit methyltransferase I n=1 Tax=Streptococcus cuniculipharyngis TaxID=1562651 RepID=A0A5C5SBT8_9STRE|nr:16S rRNA (cytidine(1402)-2'-O)-methyltransferase [Streptococcus cuniculipharyngis]TWS96642.1 16S rRNA (cytidine(1402)-2'-O)-methyltransferase [Streptococcus cuniculipharyngis]